MERSMNEWEEEEFWRKSMELITQLMKHGKQWRIRIIEAVRGGKAEEKMHEQK